MENSLFTEVEKDSMKEVCNMLSGKLNVIESRMKEAEITKEDKQLYARIAIIEDLLFRIY